MPPQGIRRRAICIICNREVAVRDNGTAYRHPKSLPPQYLNTPKIYLPRSLSGACPGSGQGTRNIPPQASEVRKQLADEIRNMVAPMLMSDHKKIWLDCANFVERIGDWKGWG